MDTDRLLLRLLATAGWFAEGEIDGLAAEARRLGRPIAEVLRATRGVSDDALEHARAFLESVPATVVRCDPVLAPPASPGDRTVALAEAVPARAPGRTPATATTAFLPAAAADTVEPLTTGQPGAPAAGGAGAPPPPPRAAGRTFGKYEIVGELGHGGMGVVYKAYHPGLKSSFAVKVLLAGSDASAEAVQRFRREAEAAARLHHPGIVAVTDIGEEEGKTYFAMEYVEGRSLKDVLDDPAAVGITPVPLPRPHGAVAAAAGGPAACDGARAWGLPPALAAQMTQEIAVAVHAAHEAGVIHRDLKPSNVLRDRAGRLKVMDFGLAKLVEAGPSGTTRTGEVMGTPAYMSPELAEGRAGKVDARSDVYQLGAILYELLTGRPPYDGETVMDILLKVMQEEPVPPRQVNPRIDLDMETICLKCLERDPARRYASADALAQDLGHYLRGEAIQARPAGLVRKAWLRIKRYKVASAAVAVLLATVVGLTVRHYLTPGTLNVLSSAKDTRVRIGGREWAVSGASLRIDLAPDHYTVCADAPDFDSLVVKDVWIERGKTKDLTLVLNHHRGMLEASCDPPGSEIGVDDIPRGSDLREFPLDTGRHRLRARRPGYFEVEAEVEVRHDETAAIALSLEPGVVWMNRASAPSGPGPLRLVGLGPEGVSGLVYQDGNAYVICAAATGSRIAAVPGGTTLASKCEVADLGGSAGRVLLLSTEEQTGLVLKRVDPRRAPGDLVAWTWTGPRRDWPQATCARVVVGPDLNGDGVAEIVVAGGDRTVWIVDGQSGKECSHYDLPISTVALAPLDAAHPDRLVFLGTPGGMHEAMTQPTWQVAGGCVRLADGGIEWFAELGRAIQSGAAVVRVRGTACVLLDRGSDLRLFEGATGKTRWTYASPTARPFAPYVMDDPFGPVDLWFLREEDGTVIGFDPQDGRPLWRRAVEPPPQGWGKNLRTYNYLPPGGLLLAGDQGVTALDLASGKTRWFADVGISARLAWIDPDGHGRPLVLAQCERVVKNHKEEGLTCLDPDGRRLWTLHLDHGVNAVIGLIPDAAGPGLPGILVHQPETRYGVVRLPSRLWSARTAKALLAAPVVGDLDGDGRPEVVQLGGWDHERTLVCFEGRTGQLRWGATQGFASNCAPGSGDFDGDGRPELVLPASPWYSHDAFRLWALRGRDGQVARDWPLEPGAHYSTPLCLDLNGDGVPDPVWQEWDRQDVRATDGRTGAVLWRFPARGPGMGAVGGADLDGDGRPDVVAPMLDGSVYALRGTDGTLLWKTAIDGGGSRSPPTLEDVIEDGTPDCLAMSQAGTLYVLDGKTGRAVWSAPAASNRVAVVGRPAVARRRGGGTIIVAPMGGAGVRAFDWERRAPLWHGPEGKTVVASPAVCDLDRDGLLEVVVATADGWVQVLDLETGRRLWALHAGSDLIEADPVVNGDLDGDGVQDIVVADHGGVLQVVSGRPTIGARRRLQK